MERVKLVYRSEDDDNFLLRYCVRNPETGVVGVYSVWGTGDREWAADRDSHHPVGLPRYNHTLNPHCEFLGGEPGHCDGSSAGLIQGESARWKDAAYSAGVGR